MIDFDASQQQVCALDVARHARILGAPGSGKTATLVETAARFIESAEFDDGALLMLAPTRLTSAALRSKVEQRVSRVIAGTIVRTPVSLAFAILQRAAAVHGDVAPRLLTGAAQDEAIAHTMARALEGDLTVNGASQFAAEVLQSDVFRGELRELARVLDDYGLSEAELRAQLATLSRQGLHGEPGQAFAFDADAVDRLLFALAVIEQVRHYLAANHQGELSASAMLRRACEIVLSEDAQALPRLVLVDHASELGEGALGLLAALAQRGTKIWVFGDPDTTTTAFQGERTRVMAGLHAELQRRGVTFHEDKPGEQTVVLQSVYRHGPELRTLVQHLTQRIGTAGAGQQRQATANSGGASGALNPALVQFATSNSASEQVGIIAHRLRERHLAGQSRQVVPWREMAVICRTRPEAARMARLLAASQVPTAVAAGGIVLREHQVVREFIRLLQHALGFDPLTSREVNDLLVGEVGRLDPISLRRLRAAVRLHEMTQATAEDRKAEQTDALIFAAFNQPSAHAVVDMVAARKLRNLGRMAAAGEAEHTAGGTPREVLWKLWETSGLAEQLQHDALEQRGVRADEANRSLDAMMGLFFALQRHEEQDSERPIRALLEELLAGSVPEDSLARRGTRDVVTVGTAQSVLGQEYDLVCVVGPQDGTWPNLRSRGTLLGTTALERWLRGELATAPSRKETLHDELRLFTQAVSRARCELLIVAVANDDQQPSAFFALGSAHRVEEELPSASLTLRGAVAQMRRRVVLQPTDTEAVDALVSLIEAGVAGAHPDEWYGVRQPSTTQPLSDIDNDPAATVNVSPSSVQTAEECALNWVLSQLGASKRDYRANLGTLVHLALEELDVDATADQIYEHVQASWNDLQFDAQWQLLRADADARAMSRAVADYLRTFKASGQQLVSQEATFEIPLQFARLRGIADRLEAHTTDDGALHVTVVDLKTGRKKPTAAELSEHAQLQAYQLGVARGAFADAEGQPLTDVTADAKLVYVHPGSLTKTQLSRGEHYTEFSRPEMSASDQQAFEQRVIEIARVMAAGQFTAQVEHHCENPNGPSKACELHIIPAVSHA